MRRISRAGSAVLAIGFALGCARASSPGLDLYFVRHAQTMANVTKNYSPANQRRFSRRGKREVAELAEKLARHRFDRILVSPTHRTLHTVAPYLGWERAVAEVWPELEECCWQKDRESPASKRIPRGDPIVFGKNVERVFTFRDDEARFWYNAQNYADSQRQIDVAVALLLERYAGTGKSVLVVGHFHIGAKMISRLTGDPRDEAIILETGKLTQLRQGADGRFRIVSLNERPFEGFE